jgi:flagellar hook-associated protein 1 FlgK
MSLINTGLTGLHAAQMGLQTAGHNIANASTPGYNRQQIVQTTNVALGGSVGMIGQGVNVATVRRVYDDLLFGQGLQAQSQSSQLDSYYSRIGQINNMFGDPNSGLSPALAGFFSGVQDLANNPESVPSRQQLLNSAQTLAARFQAMDQRFSQMGGDLNTQIDNSVTEINSLAQQIAKLNITIREVQGSYGQPANDLLDQRDSLLTRLNQEIGTTTIKESDGSLSVFIGVGQPLVTGVQVMTLNSTLSTTNLTRSVVGYVAGGRTAVIADSSLQGGKLGGYIAFRENTLDNAQNALGRIATGLAKTFNDQHHLGQDLNGAAGGDFFNVAAPRIIPNTGNTSPSSSVTASIDDVSSLTTSDYEFSYDGVTYTLKRLSDDVSVRSTTQPTLSSPLNLDGISITAVSIVARDRFLIQPTHNGARDFSVAISDTAKIAAAAPVRTSAILSTNTGSGVISAGAVNSPNNKVIVTFTSPTAFDVVDSTTGATLAKDMVYSSGSDISFNGWTAKITSNTSFAPVAGNIFTIDRGMTTTSSTTATIGVTTMNSPPVDSFLGNTVKVVFDSASSFHLEGTTNNVTGSSSLIPSGSSVNYAGVAAVASLSNGANTAGITISTDSALTSTIGTGGAGSYVSNGAKFTINGGTISGVGGGTVTVSGATVTAWGGSYYGSTTFKGVNVTINEATGAISIAASSPPTSTASTLHNGSGNGVTVTAAGAVNGGTGVISSASVSTPATLTGHSYQIKFHSSTLNQYDVIDTTTSTTVSLAQTYTDGGSITFDGLQINITGTPSLGDTFTLNPSHNQTYDSNVPNLISVNGWTAEITGSPAAGGSFVVSANTGGSADNRNALQLGGLQTKNTLNGSTSSYQSTYGQLVSQIGNKTRELESTSKAQASMVTQITTAQQSMSGVNLDEEATSLMRYQQAYQASGKILQISSTLWDTLLALK